MEGNSFLALILPPLRQKLPIELFGFKTECQANFIFLFFLVPLLWPAQQSDISMSAENCISDWGNYGLIKRTTRSFGNTGKVILIPALNISNFLSEKSKFYQEIWPSRVKTTVSIIPLIDEACTWENPQQLLRASSQTHPRTLLAFCFSPFPSCGLECGFRTGCMCHFGMRIISHWRWSGPSTLRKSFGPPS